MPRFPWVAKAAKEFDDTEAMIKAAEACTDPIAGTLRLAGAAAELPVRRNGKSAAHVCNTDRAGRR